MAASEASTVPAASAVSSATAAACSGAAAAFLAVRLAAVFLAGALAADFLAAAFLAGAGASSAGSASTCAVAASGSGVAAVFFAALLRAGAFLAGVRREVVFCTTGASVSPASGAAPDDASVVASTGASAADGAGAAADFLAGAFRVRRVTTGVAGAAASVGWPASDSVRSGWSFWSSLSMWCSSGTVTVPVRRPPPLAGRSAGTQSFCGGDPLRGCVSGRPVRHPPRSPGP